MHISQAEAAVNQLATTYVTEAARAEGLPVVDDEAVHAVYPCAGDDEWCVISVRSEEDRVAVAKIMGVAELPCSTSEFVDSVSAWTTPRDKAEIVATMQDAGVPAGPMNRAVDVLVDPQVTFRRLYAEMVHPLFEAAMPAETHPAPFRNVPDAMMLPAPMPGSTPVRSVGRSGLGCRRDRTPDRRGRAVQLDPPRTGIPGARHDDRDRNQREGLRLDGRFRKAVEVQPVIEAATGEPLGNGSAATECEIDDAVTAAGVLFPGGAATPAAERAEMLVRFADALLARAPETIDSCTRQHGMPIRLSRGANGVFPSAIFRYYAGLIGDAAKEGMRPSAIGHAIRAARTRRGRRGDRPLKISLRVGGDEDRTGARQPTAPWY